MKLRLTGYGTDEGIVKKTLLYFSDSLLQLIREYVYGYDETEIEEAVGLLLNECGATVSTAESCTGGYVAHRLTSMTGASSYFPGSIVSYSNEVKERILGVSGESLRQYGAVSEPVAIQMAEGARAKLNSTFAISTTGIAGPSGGTPEKPVGTVWIACAGPQRTVARKLQLGTLRDVNIQLTAMHVLNMLRLELENELAVR